MSNGSSAVKITAKTALKNNWVSSIVSLCIVIFSVFIFSNCCAIIETVAGGYISFAVMLLFLIFIILPLFLGLLRFFWRMLFSAKDKPISVFYFFSNNVNYKRALQLILLYTLKFAIWGAILYIPVLIVKLMSQDFIYNFVNMPIPVWTANLTTVISFLKIFSFVLIWFIMIRFYLAPVLFVSNDEIEPAETMHMSIIISKKSATDFIYLMFSFLGWILLSVFVVPIIFTVPYIITAYLVHSRFAIAEYNKHIKLSADNSFPSFTV